MHSKIMRLTHLATLAMISVVAFGQITLNSATVVPNGLPTPTHACAGCKVNWETDIYWYDNALLCFPFAKWTNLYQIWEMKCTPADIGFLCVNTAPGPCNALDDTEPSCPSGTCSF